MSVNVRFDEEEGQPFLLGDQNVREAPVENLTMLDTIRNLGRSIVTGVVNLAQHFDCLRGRTVFQPSEQDVLLDPPHDPLNFRLGELDRQLLIEEKSDEEIVTIFEESVCRIAISQNLNAISLCLNRDVIVETLNAHPEIRLSDIPNHFRGDEEIVRLCVTRNGMDLQHASTDLQRNASICRIAISQNLKAISLCLNRDVIVETLNAHPEIRLSDLSVYFQYNEEIVSLCMRRNGMDLEHASLDLRRNASICRIAISQNLNAISHCLNQDVILETLNAHPEIRLSDIPNYFRSNREIVSLCVTRNGMDLQHTSTNVQRNASICRMAISQNLNAISHCLNRDVILETLNAHPEIRLSDIPNHFRDDEEIVSLCVTRNGMDLQHANIFLRSNFRINNLAMLNTRDAFPFCLNRNLVLIVVLAEPELYAQIVSADLANDPDIIMAMTDNRNHPFFGLRGRKVLQVDREDFSKNPKKLFLDYYQFVMEHKQFPVIKFKGEAAIDMGGPTRDFVVNLFKTLSSASKEEKLPVEKTLEGDLILKLQPTDPNQPEGELDQKMCCITIGAIFAFALKDWSSIRTGHQFDNSLFCILHALNVSDISIICREYLKNSPKPAPKDYQEVENKLFKIYCKQRHAHLFAPLGTSDEDVSIAISEFVDQGKISAYMNESWSWSKDDMTDSQKKEEVIRELQFKEEIEPILYLVMGFQDILEISSWDQIKGESPAELQRNIEGSPISKEMILNALQIEGNDLKTEEWLKKWINEEASEEELMGFIQVITGSTTLSSSTKFLVAFYEAKSEEIKWKLPTSHTCGLRLDIPSNYPDYETFKQNLRATISVTKYGFQSL